MGFVLVFAFIAYSQNGDAKKYAESLRKKYGIMVIDAGGNTVEIYAERHDVKPPIKVINNDSSFRNVGIL